MNKKKKWEKERMKLIKKVNKEINKIKKKAKKSQKTPIRCDGFSARLRVLKDLCNFNVVSMSEISKNFQGHTTEINRYIRSLNSFGFNIRMMKINLITNKKKKIVLFYLDRSGVKI